MDELRSKRLLEAYNEMHYISPSLGLNYIPSPLLKYNYPSATVNTVNNIAHALLFCPKFYTQVCHLMNKMNIPPPFDDTAHSIVNLIIPRPHLSSDSVCEAKDESESEMESSGDERRTNHLRHKLQTTATKRAMRKLSTGLVGEKALNFKHKKLKIDDNANDYIEKLRKYKSENESVFETPTTGVVPQRSNIAINIVSDSISKLNANVSRDTGVHVNTETGFGVIDAQTNTTVENSGHEGLYDIREFVSDDELQSSRLSCDDWKYHSAFRDYKAGEPSIRLYLKNIAKQVNETDLQRIYGKYVDWECDTQTSMFDIRLMKDGRMRGQAFITYHNEIIATKALNETNGVVVKGKPIAVMFARSARPKQS